MTMTNEQMVANIEILSSLKETGKLGYAVARNIRKLKDAAQEYIDMRQKVFEEYGTVVDESKGLVNIPVDIYQEKLGDIMKIEHEVDVYQIPEDVFCSGAMNSAQMERLMWMVQE